MEVLYLSRKRVADLKLSVLKAEKEATHIDALMRLFSGDDDYEVTLWIRDFEFPMPSDGSEGLHYPCGTTNLGLTQNRVAESF